MLIFLLVYKFEDNHQPLLQSKYFFLGLQNNTIIQAMKKALPFTLKLPRTDTVERMQGLEFDIVFYSATVSDKELLHRSFLKEYRRLNVALTRSRKKLIWVASAFFFQSFPTTEKELIAQMPFENFFTSFC